MFREDPANLNRIMPAEERDGRIIHRIPLGSMQRGYGFLFIEESGRETKKCKAQRHIATEAQSKKRIRFGSFSN